VRAIGESEGKLSALVCEADKVLDVNLHGLVLKAEKQWWNRNVTGLIKKTYENI